MVFIFFIEKGLCVKMEYRVYILGKGYGGGRESRVEERERRVFR